jgi:hypothetical protein
MATAFEQILGIKDRKAELAQTEVRACRLAVEQAVRAVEEAKAEAERFSQYLVQRQGELYDGLQAKVCERGDIDEVREEIARMRGHEASLHTKIEEAEAERRKAVERLEAAKQAQLRAIKNVEKFKQLVQVERTEAAIEEQAKEDNELEEFVRLGEPLDA